MIKEVNEAMKRFALPIVVALLAAIAAMLIPQPTPARASSAGHRNTAILLGAAALYSMYQAGKDSERERRYSDDRYRRDYRPRYRDDRYYSYGGYERREGTRVVIVIGHHPAPRYSRGHYSRDYDDRGWGHRGTGRGWGHDRSRD